jgi:hypothetical protein
MGAARPHNPAARGELLALPRLAKSKPNQNNKPTLNTKLRILPEHIDDQSVRELALFHDPWASGGGGRDNSPSGHLRQANFSRLITRTYFSLPHEQMNNFLYCQEH